MGRFVEGADRHQVALLPDCLDDYVGTDNSVRVVDAFVDEIDLAALSFVGIVPAATGRPSYHPAALLKLYLYGYLNQVASSRRLDADPTAMRVRRRTVEHVFGTIKGWMGAEHFRMRKLRNVATEMSLHVLAYNLRRVIAILGARPLIAALRA